MKKIFLVVFILLLSVWLFSEKEVTLPELMKPNTISVDNTQLYVTENASVFVYSLADFKLKNKFGKQGQGPQEFALHPRVQLSVDSSTDVLIINSLGKLSFFTKKGEFIKEIRTMPNFFNFQPIGDQFLGLGQAFEEKALYNTVNIFDNELKKIKEVYRADSGLKGPGKGIQVLSKPFLYQGYKQMIVLPGQDDSMIDAYDLQMKKLFTITVKCEKLKVPQDFKDKVIHYFKTSARTKDIYEILLKPVSFPEYYPVFQAFFVVDDLFFVMTWKKENEKNEFFIYDLAGKFMKKTWIPLVYQNELELYPITINDGKLYQLIEDPDSEGRLHISPIDI
jgi:hypothetical protein